MNNPGNRGGRERETWPGRQMNQAPQASASTATAAALRVQDHSRFEPSGKGLSTSSNSKL